MRRVKMSILPLERLRARTLYLDEEWLPRKLRVLRIVAAKLDTGTGFKTATSPADR